MSNAMANYKKVGGVTNGLGGYKREAPGKLERN